MSEQQKKSYVKIEKFEIGEAVQVRNLTGDDSFWNGSECVVASAAYTHPAYNKVVINVILEGDGTWALEPWNLKKIENHYDGGNPAEWKDIAHIWKPKALR